MGLDRGQGRERMTNTARSMSHTAEALFQGYRPAPGGSYDELLDPHGKIRPHWRTLMEGLGGLSEDERNGRAIRMDRRVRETGIAYDIFADPNRPAQRWQLDLAPVVFSHAEWRWLETALIQRARLFDAVLDDLYGEQRLMRQGLIPPELVFSDSSFLRPCQGVLPNAGGLQFYAADLARGADGHWRIIDSHTETLAGIGFALANRVVHTHVAGDVFKHCNATRLAPFFQNLQSALTARSGRDNARIALLTPGPHHADYFSHAYLARYLGYLLVEGSDLRTKGSQVYLKTLEGLKEIDLIVRCVDGRAIDPLELDPSGFDGPAGLLRVCRKAPQLVLNAAGSALAQNRGLGSFLPKLSRAAARRGADAAGRAAVLARRRRGAGACARQSRWPRHPQDAGRHGPAGTGGARPGPARTVRRRARSLAARDRAARRAACGRGEDRVQHRAGLRAHGTCRRGRSRSGCSSRARYRGSRRCRAGWP